MTYFLKYCIIFLKDRGCVLTRDFCNLFFLCPIFHAGPLLEQVEAALTKRPMSNTRRVADRNLGPMLPATRNILKEFHQPFNHKLASVLDNNTFLWSNT